MKVMLAQTWEPKKQPVLGWFVSEKLDGVRAYTDKTPSGKLWTRNGKPIYAPKFFEDAVAAAKNGLDLDGELFSERGKFDEISAMVRTKKKTPEMEEKWRATMKFHVFDSPSLAPPFEERMQKLQETADFGPDSPLVFVQQREVKRAQDPATWLREVLRNGGEGLMLRKPGSMYEPGKRSKTLLKHKVMREGDAQVIGHLPGEGKYTGMVGALLVVLLNKHMKPTKTQFQVGSGLTDEDRKNAPAIGSVISFQYQNWTVDGKPRFPVFRGIRPDF